MEITLHTPLQEWYAETPLNPLDYWGIDYPPLSAYQSYLTGLLIEAIEPEATALVVSRGHETPSSKRAMRMSVIICDLVGAILMCWADSTCISTRIPALRATTGLSAPIFTFDPCNGNVPSNFHIKMKI